MRTYKEKLENLIGDLNSTISDTLFNPEYNGWEYVLSLTEIDKHISCRLEFKDGNKTLAINYQSTEGDNLTDEIKNDFYGKCYFTIFRLLLYGVDDRSMSPFKDPVTGATIGYLSVTTLTDKGLCDFPETTNK